LQLLHCLCGFVKLIIQNTFNVGLGRLYPLGLQGRSELQGVYRINVGFQILFVIDIQHFLEGELLALVVDAVGVELAHFGARQGLDLA